jgi:hypothetical protein
VVLGGEPNARATQVTAERTLQPPGRPGRLLGSPARVGAVVGAGLLVIAGLRIVAAGGDVSRFLVAGERWTDPEKTPVPIETVPGPGYDGQFFFRLALDPFARRAEANGITLDSPAYRQQRILYPLLARGLGIGSPRGILLAMIGVNLAALCCIGWLFGRIARSSRQHPAWGLLPALSGGLVLAFGRDLSEPVAAAALAASVFLAVSRRWALFSVALSLAILARESAVLAVAGAGMALVAAGVRPQPGGTAAAEHSSGTESTEVRDGDPHRADRPRLTETSSPPRCRSGRPSWLWLVPPIAVFVLWQFFLYGCWGHLPATEGRGNVGWPLQGIGEALVGWIRAAWGGGGGSRAEAGVALCYLAWIGWLAILVGRRHGAAAGSSAARDVRNGFAPDASFALRFCRMSWLIWSVAAALFSTAIWGDDWSFTRVLGDWSLLGVAILLLERRPPGFRFVLFSGLILAGSAIRLIVRP